MSDTAKSLVEQMVAAEGWPEPQLLEAILEQNEQAVPPLLEVVHEEVYDFSDVQTLCHASLLLGSLEATSAIPDLVELFYRYDSDLLEDVYRSLAVMGAKAVEPALAVACDGSLGWYPRAMATQAAIEASTQDLALRAQVTAALRELLADYVARAETLDEEEIDMATSLVSDLARLADPEARPLIDAAFEADIVDQWVIEPKHIADRYRRGGEEMSSPGPRAWLRRYRGQYQEHLNWERRRRREAQKPKRRGTPARRRERPNLGRNDPCWCGSGKKYKHCHLRHDLER